MLARLTACVLGAALWGLWVLLWRSPSWPVILVGVIFPASLYFALSRGLVLLRVPKSFFRLDLWCLFGGLVLWRIFLSVCRVGWSIITGCISPGIVVVPLRLRTEAAQLLLFWAVTVTPGTIALVAEGDVLYVHCLCVSPATDLPGLARLQGLLEKLLE
ncbi:MAG: Na+/H+ antiporter subunit E [Candidatus Bipolaricaulota bacterium]|nr:Na+/H+ antiporter subunit E [Candidatus Bipolaricaulota bacterium]MDW8126564.1 Na+/H+ antiporter subunit E [Candidatus Bipolaricaulota bacterium]